MPHVASPSAKLHPQGHTPAHAAQSAPAQDRGTPSLFDSLVDDSAPPPAPSQAQGTQPAAAHGNTPPAGQPAKADKDQLPAAPPAGPDAAPVVAKPGDTTTAADLEAAIKAAADAAKPDAPKDTDKSDASKDSKKADAAADPGKTDAKPDAAAAQAAAVVPDPSLLADAATPAAAPVAAAAVTPPPLTAPAVTPPAAAAIQTVPATAQAPVQPAFIAAATAQKLQAFDGKDGIPAGKPAASDGKTATATTPAPAALDDELSAPQPQAPATPATPAAAPGAPPAVAGKAPDKPEMHHGKIDATAALPAPAAGTAPDGPDAGLTAQSSAVSAATGAAAQAATASAGGAAAQAAPSAPLPIAIPLAGLAVEIAGRAHAGKNNFEIRLDPPELGRIEVKLSVDRQGQVTSHLIADRADTLDLLRRDASGLERALQDAGLKTAGQGLQFSLRDQSFNGQQKSGSRPNVSQVVAVDDTLPVIDPAASGYIRYAGRIGGVDIRV